MREIVLLTEKRYLSPKIKNTYIKNILLEDKLLEKALKSQGVESKRLAWENYTTLQNNQHILFRTPWNYFEKLNKFKSFLEENKAKTTFINSYDQVLWNLDKVYLLELNKQGINIPETVFLKRGSEESLKKICDEKNWVEVVVKPSVSAAGWETYHLRKESFSGFEEKFQLLLQNQNMLIQAYQKKITSFGEISLMMIGGEYSHAVIKKAKRGEFRVQDDYGGTVEMYMAGIKEINFAKTVMKKLNFCPLYARVDVILDNQNTLALSELELIEPEMWFRKNPNSVEKLAVEIKKRYF